MIYKPFFRDDLGYKPRYTQPLHLEEVVVSPIYDSENGDSEIDINSLGYKPVYKNIWEGVEIKPPKKESVLSYTFQSKEDFKNAMIPIYTNILSEKGLDPLFAKSLVAQDGLESEWGSKPSGDNNFGGIKGKGRIKSTREVINGKDIYLEQEFRNFNSLEDYARYKVDLLNGKRYKAFDGGLEDFSRRVSSGGYATDPRYKEILDKVIKSVKKGCKIEKANLGTILSANEPRIQRRPGVGVLKNDYFGKDKYDYSMSPEIPEDGEHWPSRDPYTGLLLKGDDHPTIFHEYEQSSERGLKLYEDRNGRQYTLEEWQVNMPEYILKGLKAIDYPSYGDGSITMKQRIDANIPKVKYIWDRLVSAGASKEQAAAILGNMYRESHFDYKNINKSSNARGLVQMLGQRWDAYEEFLSLNPDKVDSTESQMDYLIPIIFGDDKNPHGLKNLYTYKIKNGEDVDLPYDSYGIDWSRSQRAAFRNAKTLEDMVSMFENKFERANGDGMNERQAAARYIYNLMSK